MAAPQVSVVVSCFNQGGGLAEAVDSVLGQSFTDVDVLIVDAGSTDDQTRTILDAFNRPRTRVLRSGNCGRPAAKNLGIANTSGELLCMLDADDRLERQMLARSVARLGSSASIAFASHWARVSGDEPREWTPSSCEYPALLDANTVSGSALVRRSAMDAVGGFDETFLDGGEDWDLWIALVERGLAGSIIPEFLVRHCPRTGSAPGVSMRGEAQPDVYRRLATKHAAAYRAYLEPLLVRREREEAHLRGRIHDLELDAYLVATPQLTSARDNLREAVRARAAQRRWWSWR